LKPVLAGPLLRSVLAGLDALFTRTRIGIWREQVRRVAAAESAGPMAAAYRVMAKGSAPGTFHDRIISVRNRDAITEAQEPFVNELLTTLESLGMSAAMTIAADGEHAAMRETAEQLAARYVWHYVDGSATPSRSEHVVTGMRCKTCHSRYSLDGAPRLAAACQWALTVAPGRIAAGRSRALVDAALDPERDALTSRELERMKAPFEAVGLPVISLPYNKPGHAPNDRCRTCGADDWGTIHWRLIGEPPLLEPLE
jgi:cytochrome c5